MGEARQIHFGFAWGSSQLQTTNMFSIISFYGSSGLKLNEEKHELYWILGNSFAAISGKYKNKNISRSNNRNKLQQQT